MYELRELIILNADDNYESLKVNKLTGIVQIQAFSISNVLVF